LATAGFCRPYRARGSPQLASEVVREGLRLVEEREAALQALRAMLDASIAAGGEASDAEIDTALEAKAAQLAKEGF
jgi:antitoxin ParD1/3/4